MNLETILNSIIPGDALKVQRELPEGIFDCAVTSPPYWALRKYDTEGLVWEDGWRGELGSEPDPLLYIDHLVQIFMETWRVLKPGGSLWVNISDTFSGSGGDHLPGAGRYKHIQYQGKQIDKPYFKTPAMTLKSIRAKSQCCIPERLKIAMVDNGWICRDTIIWYKPNGIPESCTDRFTRNFEYFYHFVKSNRTIYWTNSKTKVITDKKPPGTKGIEGEDWDYKDCEYCSKTGKDGNGNICYRCKGKGKYLINHWTGHDYYFEQQLEKYTSELDRWGGPEFKPVGGKGWNEGTGQELDRIRDVRPNPYGRNKRSVWKIKLQPSNLPHFAAYPEALIETPIMSCCPEFVCTECGLPAYPLMGDPVSIKDGGGCKNLADELGTSPTSALRTKQWNSHKHTGYAKCACDAEFKPGLVLDMFMGTGRTGIVARKLNRNYVGIELNQKYVKMATNELRICEDILREERKQLTIF